MKATVRILALMFMVCFFFRPAYGASNAIPQPVLDAAEHGLSMFKDRAGAQPGLYGFAGADDVKRTTLGEGFQVYYVDPVKLSKASDTTDLLAITYQSGIWEFTVNIDGRPKSYLTIGQENGQYQVVHFGGDAEAFGTALSNLRKFVNGANASFEPTVVKAGPAYHITARVGSQEYAIPAVRPERSGITGGMDNSQVQASRAIVSHLKRIQKNTQTENGQPTIVSGGGTNEAPSGWFHSPGMWAPIGAGFGLAALAFVWVIRRTRVRH